MKRPVSILVVFAFCVSLILTSCSEKPKGPDPLLSRGEDIEKVQALLPCACEDTTFIDLSAHMPPVQNQGNVDNCVGWALCYACRSFYHYQINHANYYKGRDLDSSHLASPYFIFNAIRKKNEPGVNMLRALYFLRDSGTATWDQADSIAVDTRYREDRVMDSIMDEMRVYTFRRVCYDTNGVTLDEIRNALKCDDPVLAAVEYDDHYFHQALYGAKYANWDTFTKATESHAIVIVGYDDVHGYFKFMNSQGPKWGNKGFGKMRYSVAEKVIREAYVLIPRPPVYAVENIKNMIDSAEEKGGELSQYERAHPLPGKKGMPHKHRHHALDSLILKSLTLDIDTITNTDIRMSLQTEDPLLRHILSSNDSSLHIYVRLFSVHEDGKTHQSINKNDPAHKLGNGQMAFKMHSVYVGVDESGSNYEWSLSIPLESLTIAKEKGQIHKSDVVKMKAEPVFYIGNQPIAYGKAVEVDVRE